MYGSVLGVFSFWWIIPVVMMVLCFFMMRRRRGTMMCGFGCCGRDRQQAKGTESSMDKLNRRYASGDIDQIEYGQVKRTLDGPVHPETD